VVREWPRALGGVCVAAGDGRLQSLGRLSELGLSEGTTGAIACLMLVFMSF
jgi:hypothetical protein